MDADSKKIILNYVKSNGAEYSSAKRAVKIVGSLGGQTPVRITEVPYIRDKHRGAISQPMPSRGNLWDRGQTASLVTPPLKRGSTRRTM